MYTFGIPFVSGSLIFRETAEMSNHLTTLYSVGSTLMHYGAHSLQMAELKEWLMQEKGKSDRAGM
jgi:hypothetical protein